MYFIGQDRIVRELDILIRDMLSGNNHNILFRAPSGYGKTRLALISLTIIGSNNGSYYLPSSDGLKLVPPLNLEKRMHIIDEAHKLKSQENLYPYMDSNNYIFYILTNETGELKEPLMNRCIQFIFDPYSQEELEELTRQQLENFRMSNELISEISRRCIHPREVKVICERLIPIFRISAIPQNPDEMNSLLTSLLRIDRDGLDNSEKRYLEFLRKVNRASLDTLSNYLRVDKATILRDIEPKLIYLGKISITAKGRIINESQ